MTVRLELKPELEASLMAAAKARGIPLEKYLEQVIQGHVTDRPVVSAQDWERELDEWAESFPEMPPLSDEAMSRESMYPDRW